MAYKYQHYPLAMYRNGAYMAVANEAEELAAKADGWTDYTSDRERVAVKPADAPPAVVAVTQPEPASDDPLNGHPVPSEGPEAPTKRKPGRPPKVSQ